MPQIPIRVKRTAPALTVATILSKSKWEYGSNSLPAMPAVIAIPAIIISHVIVAAAARRRGAVAVANKANSEVPDAPTPNPIAL